MEKVEFKSVDELETIKAFLARRINIPVSEELIGHEIVIAGWIQTARWQPKMIFMKIYDSADTILKPLQVIFEKKNNPEYYGPLDHVLRGSSLIIKGKLVKSPKTEQPIELIADKYFILGKTEDPSLYPLAHADLTSDYLRTIPQTECHVPVKSVVYNIRSNLMNATEEFFRHEKFKKVETPLITFSECEGGCQPMQTTLFFTSGKISDIPTKKDLPDEIDFSKDFFGKKAFLTVSSQLELETNLPLGNVWTITRALRGEKSATSRHLCEFSMLELEMGFTHSSEPIINMSEKYIKYCLSFILKNCSNELKFLESKLERNIINNLVYYIDNPFGRITHKQAVDILLEKYELFKEVPNYEEDLTGEHEKYLVDVIYKKPLIITNYPKKIKAFYMPVILETIEESKGIEHVDNFDILVPEVGELVGGSQRINNYEELVKRIDELGLDKKPLEFYIEMRRCGSIPHGGMGLGIERFVKFITCMDSVRDCVSFPRFYKCG